MATIGWRNLKEKDILADPMGVSCLVSGTMASLEQRSGEKGIEVNREDAITYLALTSVEGMLQIMREDEQVKTLEAIRQMSPDRVGPDRTYPYKCERLVPGGLKKILKGDAGTKG